MSGSLEERKAVLSEIGELLSDVVLNSPKYTRAFGKNKVEKEVYEGRELTGDEKSILIGAIRNHLWLMQVASGAEDLVTLPHAAQVKQTHIRKLAEELNAAKTAFSNEFPELSKSSSLNSAAQSLMAEVMQGISGRRIGASVIDLVQSFTKPAEAEVAENGVPAEAEVAENGVPAEVA